MAGVRQGRVFGSREAAVPNALSSVFFRAATPCPRWVKCGPGTDRFRLSAGPAAADHPVDCLSQFRAGRRRPEIELSDNVCRYNLPFRHQPEEAEIAAVLTDDSIVTGVLPSQGLAVRGAFHPRPEDAVPDFSDNTKMATLVLVGWTGGQQWSAFAASPEASDAQPHPLDRWSRRLLDAAATALHAVAFYPFGGPPYHDFQLWALRAEPVARSPIGLLIHPEWGLWHAYRGALGFQQRLALTEITDTASPCETCADRPCLSSCPVEAFSTEGGYDVATCGQHLDEPAGQVCLTQSCAARRACPVRLEAPYSASQSAFHMHAFLKGRRRGARPGGPDLAAQTWRQGQRARQGRLI